MEQYNDWTVIKEELQRHGKRTKTMWLCRCKCGKESWQDMYNIKSGRSRRCKGCQGMLKRSKYFGHKLVSIWEAMKQRCNNEKCDAYKHYGGRGITIHPPWNDSMEVFADWCMENGWEEGLQLDRRDNDLNYTPDNCRFVTPQKNLRNTRLLKATNTSGYRGVTKINQITGVKYKSSFTFLSTVYRLGHYDTAEEAAKVRDEFIVRFRIPSPLNFPRDDYNPADIDDEFERSGVDMEAVAKEIAVRKKPRSSNRYGVVKIGNRFIHYIHPSVSGTKKKLQLSFPTEDQAAESRNKMIDDHKLKLRRS